MKQNADLQDTEKPYKTQDASVSGILLCFLFTVFCIFGMKSGKPCIFKDRVLQTWTSELQRVTLPIFCISANISNGVKSFIFGASKHFFRYDVVWRQRAFYKHAA